MNVPAWYKCNISFFPTPMWSDNLWYTKLLQTSRSSYRYVPEISIPRLVTYYVILTSFFFPTPMWSDNLWYTKVPIITTL